MVEWKGVAEVLGTLADNKLVVKICFAFMDETERL